MRPDMAATSQEQDSSRGTALVPKWLLLTLVGFLVVFTATVLLSGQAVFLIPAAILVVIVAGYALLQGLLARRILEREGSVENAMSDNANPIPSTNVIPDDGTALGDTSEAHDELSPHDLPLWHPGRQAAERQAAEAREGEEPGTTRGDADPSQTGESRERRSA